MSSITKAFQVTSNGVFMERRGAGWNDERRFSQKKLCFVATDQALLADVLSELADRPDCYYVKYSIEPRDGMYLGRCFLTQSQLADQLAFLFDQLGMRWTPPVAAATFANPTFHLR